MEWVETTGRTIEEAKEAALDELGVDEDEAEFDVLAEPKPGLFGRVRGEARVRARVRPTKPPPKVDRRGRRRKPGTRTDEGSAEAAPEMEQAVPPSGARKDAPASSGDTSDLASGDEDPVAAAPARRSGGGRSTSTGRRGAAAAAEGGPVDEAGASGGVGDEEREAALAGAMAAAQDFAEGLVRAFDLEGTVMVTPLDDAVGFVVSVLGEDLGLLIGPKGQTLSAIQDVLRTVVSHHSDGIFFRVSFDVAGYRERRREALTKFASQIAEEVVRSGAARALEPMNAADRKTVHDAVNKIAGVHTVSEGEDPARRVVILPGDG